MKKLLKYKYEAVFFVIFMLSRAPFIGAEMFNTDVWKWKARIYDFGSGVFNLQFDKTLQKYHPGVTLMWIGTAAVKFQSAYCTVINCPNEQTDPVGAVFALNFFQQLFVVLAIGIVLTLTFYPLRLLFGKKYAFIALLLLSFEPFFYALTRVIHLEGLMTSFMLASFVWLFYYLHNGKIVRLVTCAVFAGLALLTKSSAIFLLPLSLLSILILRGKNLRPMIKESAIFLLGVFAIYFTLWPSMWVQPIKTLDYVFVRGIKETGFEEGHDQIFLGQYTLDPGPTYYLVVAGLKFSPVLITGIVFFVLLLKSIVGYFPADKYKRFVLLTVLFALGYFLEITIPSKKLDRYILPTLASLSLLAGFFYTWLITVVNKKASFQTHSVIPSLRGIPYRLGYISDKGSFSRHGGIRMTILMLVFVIGIGYQALSLTPDYFSYYNPVFGGLAKGIYLLEPKWIIGQHQITKYFSELMVSEGLEPFAQGESFDNQKDLSKKLTVAFPEKYYTQIWPFIRQIGGWAVIEALTPNAQRTSYFVYPVWDDYANRKTRFKLTYMDSIYLRGVKLYNVYQKL